MIEYEITNIDYWENDAILVLNGYRIYFQWSKEPSLYEALRFISAEMMQVPDYKEMLYHAQAEINRLGKDLCSRSHVLEAIIGLNSVRPT